jgi:integral membrane protein (TIGR00529 family)
MLKNRRLLSTTLFIFGLALTFALFGHFKFSDTPKIFNYTFFNLLILVILVQAITSTFKVKNFHLKVLKLISSLSGDIRYSLLVPPIIFGLLPMPAGAMLTADLSRKAGEELKAERKWVFFFNYWFRHVCEFSWPLYGALIIAAGLANIPVKDFLVSTLPYMGLALLIGLFFLFTRVKGNGNGEKVKAKGSEIIRYLISALWPVILIITLTFMKVDMKITLLVVLLLLFLFERVGFKEIIYTVKNSMISEITLIVLVVLIFKGVVENTSILSSFANFLSRHNVPAIVPVIILPMIMAFLTGITSAGIGATAPILSILFAQNPAFPYVAYISAIAGVLLSPFHLCLITTKEYYKISFKDVYSTILLPVGVIETIAILRGLL